MHVPTYMCAPPPTHTHTYESCTGYPLELHTVTTADGYVLQMERIPRPGCARVVFFLHGIMDTSLTWVSRCVCYVCVI
jgi:Partial alpha/beta-hydrolase lipase region